LRRNKKTNKMETKILLKNESLWERLQKFSLDNANATFPFSKKLAKEESWTFDFTQRAIEEYKKFVYLCCISPNGASPSEIVDKVWHMHLIYTQNYWEEFCPNILKQNLHHHPSNGGFEEKDKHENWFTETLENYKKVFSKEPPEDIWKNQIIKAEPKIFWKKYFKIFYLALLFLLVYSCSNEGSSAVLTLFIILIISSFMLVVIFSANFGESGNRGKNDSNSGSDGSGGGGSSCGGGGSSCGGGGCGGGCGGCGGG